jgi:hypothetical protein
MKRGRGELQPGQLFPTNGLMPSTGFEEEIAGPSFNTILFFAIIVQV